MNVHCPVGGIIILYKKSGHSLSIQILFPVETLSANFLFFYKSEYALQIILIAFNIPFLSYYF